MSFALKLAYCTASSKHSNTEFCIGQCLLALAEAKVLYTGHLQIVIRIRQMDSRPDVAESNTITLI